MWVPRWLNRALNKDAVGIGGYVTAWATDERGKVRDFWQGHNIGTNWARYAIAEWYLGPTSGSSNSGIGAIVPPNYIAVGNGTGTASQVDTNMFQYEQTGMRRATTYASLYNGYTAQLTLAYTATDPKGTFTDYGLWDALPGTASVGAAGATSGSTTLPLASGAPAVYGGTTAGQYSTIYIVDGTNSEYASIATTATAGASSWTLQSALAHSHAAGVSITVFNGHLWAHTQGSVTVGTGQQLSVQWSVPINVTT